MMKNTIKSIADLAEAIGLERGATPYQIGRALYKGVECGPWISFYFSDKPESKVLHTAEIRQKGNKLFLSKLTPEHKDIRHFLGFDDNGENDVPKKPEVFASLDSYAKTCESVKKSPNAWFPIKSVRKCIGCVRVTVELVTPAKLTSLYYGDKVPDGMNLRKCVGVQIGSIVEGSEVEFASKGFAFPFTKKAFFQEMDRINDEAKVAWEEANCE